VSGRRRRVWMWRVRGVRGSGCGFLLFGGGGRLWSPLVVRVVVVVVVVAAAADAVVGMIVSL